MTVLFFLGEKLLLDEEGKGNREKEKGNAATANYRNSLGSPRRGAGCDAGAD